jgi:site-specific DNA recombinase
MIAFLKAHPSCRTILVEKTDRLYRNVRDWLTIDELDIAVHFVREGTVVSRTSRSSDKFMHGMKVLMAKNYVDNLSEEVRKGLREKAEQGHRPGVAHVGYINNRVTRRIDVDAERGPLVADVFHLYASGGYSLKGLARKAFEIGLRHSRGDRRMTTSEIHRMLQNPIYTGDFRWCGKRRKGSHAPLITHDLFDQVHAMLHRKSHVRGAKRKHAFMGLLTCARCGCALTAEMKKGKYVYYRCTGAKGACGNGYIREEQLADLLVGVITPIQISADVADDIAKALAADEGDSESRRLECLRRLEQRQRMVIAKLDRGYEDFVAGRIPEEMWLRKSGEWEDERATVEAERSRHDEAARCRGRQRGENLRTREIGLQIAEFRTAASTARNRALELHVRSRNSVRDLHFAVRSTGQRERNWKLAERVGFVPVDDPSFNDLRLNSIAKNSQNSQNPGSRYKTGTVNRGRETHPRAAFAYGPEQVLVAMSRPDRARGFCARTIAATSIRSL